MRPGGRSGPATGRSRARRTSATAGHAARTAALANSPRPDRPPRSRPTRRAHNRRRKQPAARLASTQPADAPRTQPPPQTAPRPDRASGHTAADAPRHRTTAADAPRHAAQAARRQPADAARQPPSVDAGCPSCTSATNRRPAAASTRAADRRARVPPGTRPGTAARPARTRRGRPDGAGNASRARGGPTSLEAGRPAGTHRPVTDGAPTTSIRTEGRGPPGYVPRQAVTARTDGPVRTARGRQGAVAARKAARRSVREARTPIESTVRATIACPSRSRTPTPTAERRRCREGWMR